MADKWYVLCCNDCDREIGYKLPIPFASAQARGQWASEHRRGTGHHDWLVLEHGKDETFGQAYERHLEIMERLKNWSVLNA